MEGLGGRETGQVETWVIAVEVGGGLRVAHFGTSPYLMPHPLAVQSWVLDPGIFKTFHSDPLEPSVPLHGQLAHPGGPGFL